MNFLKLKEIALNIIFPIECLGCQKEDTWLCDRCLKKLEFSQKYFINKNAFSYLDGVFVVFNYQDKLIKKIIKTFKYNFAKDLGKTLGIKASILLKELQEEGKIDLKNKVVMPVPLHKRRKNWRGFNQAEIIAEEIIKKFGTKKIEGNLIRIKNDQPQAKLSKEKRKENVLSSFSWQGKNLEDQKIILVDDIYTTGSTMEECAKILKKAGAKQVQGLVIAHG